MVLYGSSVRLVDARWAKDRRVVVSRHRARPRRSRGWSPRVPAFARARRRGVENAFFFFISCVFSRRVASTRRGRETSPRDIPIESNSLRFRSVRFRSTSVSVVGWIVSRADDWGERANARVGSFESGAR